MTFKRLAFCAACILMALSWALTAAAVDGVIEINHARALVGGVTASDLPGYPVTIDASGSYRLTGDLTPPDSNTHGVQILVSALDTTIDLNGFSIVGPNVCIGLPVTSCTAPGSGVGILLDFGNERVGVTIRDGTIRGMGADGIRAWGNTVRMRISDVMLIHNGRNGLDLSGGSFSMALVSEARAHENGDNGIVVIGGSSVEDSVSRGNASSGITCGPGSSCRFSDNVVSRNGGAGIFAINATTIDGCTVSFNGGVGIFTGDGSTVTNNTVSWNTGLGLQGNGGDVAIAHNSFRNNNGGAEVQNDGFGVEIGGNYCGTDTTCP
jgi:parallel beta-helix repeat protein